jgi:hypothetical protein
MKASRRIVGIGVLVAILVSIPLGSSVSAQGDRARERSDAGMPGNGRLDRERTRSRE